MESRCGTSKYSLISLKLKRSDFRTKYNNLPEGCLKNKNATLVCVLPLSLYPTHDHNI